MSKAIYFVAGATAGVYAVTKARRAAEAFTPDGFRDRLSGLSLGAHLFTEELRTEMATRENDLRERLGLVPDGQHELASATRPLHRLELIREGNR